MARYDHQLSMGYSPNHSAVPSVLNTPVIFSPPTTISGGYKEVWMAASCNDVIYGGCIVHASLDGATYKKVGSISGQSLHGLLTSSLSASQSNTPSVYSTQYFYVDTLVKSALIEGITQEEFNTYQKLCLVGNEIVEFKTALLQQVYSSGLSNYKLSYLYRSLYGTVGGGSIGSRFVMLDKPLFKYRYNAELGGNYVYLKFQGFNLWRGGLQNIASLPSYAFLIPS